MRKDIVVPKVEDIALAVVKELNELNEEKWYVYLLNLKGETIEGVLVSSKGYGKVNGEDVKTSQLRHFLDTLPPKTFKKVELIQENLFGLSNQYWVSFYLNKQMYDKKYVFLAESITEKNFTEIPLLGLQGVMIR